jgi:hypothetical protein
MSSSRTIIHVPRSPRPSARKSSRQPRGPGRSATARPLSPRRSNPSNPAMFCWLRAKATRTTRSSERRNTISPTMKSWRRRSRDRARMGLGMLDGFYDAARAPTPSPPGHRSFWLWLWDAKKRPAQKASIPPPNLPLKRGMNPSGGWGEILPQARSVPPPFQGEVRRGYPCLLSSFTPTHARRRP